MERAKPLLCALILYSVAGVLLFRHFSLSITSRLVLADVAASDDHAKSYPPESYLPESYLPESYLPESYPPSEELPRWNEGDTIDNKSLTVHSYHEGTLFPGFEMLYDSYLVSQDLDSSRFVQWMAEDWASSSDPYKRWIVERYSGTPSIEFRLLDHRKLAEGTCFADREEFLNIMPFYRTRLPQWTDVVRLLLLFHYGGIWVDSDTILLMDFVVLHKINKDKIVAGYMERYGENGAYNNNFLHMTAKQAREKILEVACEFRHKPTYNLTGDVEYKLVIPHIGDDNHEMFVLNKWIYNDGTLRRCHMRNDCPLEKIDLRQFDPAWWGRGDLNSMCETLRDSFSKYFHDFQALLTSKAWINSTDYLTNIDWKRHVWTVHSRLRGCRSRTGPLGLLKHFQSLISERMFGDPRLAPRAPADFLSFDKYEIRLDDHLVQFYDLIIVVASGPMEFAKRQAQRSLLNSPSWFGQLDAESSVKHKLLFIVPYQDIKDRNANNPRLAVEQAQHKDLILVDPQRSKSGEESHGAVSPEIRRGMLKILNQFEGYVFLLLLDTKVFVQLRNLYTLIDAASDRTLHDKMKPFKSFLISHKTEDRKAETDLYGRYNATVFAQDRGQKYVLFSRSNLPILLGLPSIATQLHRLPTLANATVREALSEGLLPEEMDVDKTGDTYVLTTPVTTLRVASNRLPLQDGKVAKLAEKRVLAKTPEDFAHTSRRYEEIFRDENVKLMGQSFAWGCKADRPPENPVNTEESLPADLLPTNLTFVINVRCATGMHDLHVASLVGQKALLDL